MSSERGPLTGEELDQLVAKLNELTEKVAQTMQMNTHLLHAVDAAASLAITMPRALSPLESEEKRNEAIAEVNRLIAQAKEAIDSARLTYWNEDGTPRSPAQK